jgi:hypothetical protein
MLPAATSESKKVWRISGRAMPSVATIIDGIKFEQGTMVTDRRSRFGAGDKAGSAMGVPISAE